MIIAEKIGHIAVNEVGVQVGGHVQGLCGGSCQDGDAHTESHVVEDGGDVTCGHDDVHLVAQPGFGDEVVKLHAGTGILSGQDERLLDDVA